MPHIAFDEMQASASTYADESYRVDLIVGKAPAGGKLAADRVTKALDIRPRRRSRDLWRRAPRRVIGSCNLWFRGLNQ